MRHVEHRVAAAVRLVRAVIERERHLPGDVQLPGGGRRAADALIGVQIRKELGKRCLCQLPFGRGASERGMRQIKTGIDHRDQRAFTRIGRGVVAAGEEIRGLLPCRVGFGVGGNRGVDRRGIDGFHPVKRGDGVDIGKLRLQRKGVCEQRIGVKHLGRLPVEHPIAPGFPDGGFHQFVIILL